MTAHELLVKALNRVERDGWGKGGPGSADFPVDGPPCLGDAIALTAGAQDRRARTHWIHVPEECAPPVVQEAMRVCLDTVGYDGPLWIWNDVRCQGPDHAKAVLREAIAATAPPPPDPKWSEIIEDLEAVA